jgi:hypothetical protein
MASHAFASHTHDSASPRIRILPAHTQDGEGAGDENFDDVGLREDLRNGMYTHDVSAAMHRRPHAQILACTHSHRTRPLAPRASASHGIASHTHTRLRYAWHRTASHTHTRIVSTSPAQVAPKHAAAASGAASGTASSAASSGAASSGAASSGAASSGTQVRFAKEQPPPVTHIAVV